MKVISLFSGAGGMDLGFVQAGYRIVWANDNWKDAVSTYRLNFGDHVCQSDIEKIDPRAIPDADILVGGFPCQGFSVANTKRHTGDKRNLLYQQLLRILNSKRPTFFLAENVKGILSLDKGKVFALILKDFEAIGYGVQTAVLNAADFGVPQRRERVFFFGTRGDFGIPPKFPPPPTHAPRAVAAMLGLAPWLGVAEALRGLPDPDSPHSIEHHEYTKYKLRFNGYLGHRRVDGSMPAPTITARGDERGGVVIHHHPNNKRRLTARETAVIQSFPLGYKFFGCKTSVYRQVANAVPPRLSNAIARWLAAEVSKGGAVEETAEAFLAEARQ